MKLAFLILPTFILGSFFDVHADTITLLDGEIIDGDLTALSADGIAVKGQKDLFPLTDVRLVQTGQKPNPQRPNRDVGLELIDGSKVEMRTLSVKGENVIVGGDVAKEWRFGLDLVRRIRLKPRRSDENINRLFNTEPEAFDQILVEVDGEVQAVKGVIAKIGDDFLEFEWEDKREKLDREKVYAIIVADAKSSNRLPKSMLTLRDHSLLKFTDIKLEKGKAQATILGGNQIEVPWKDVVELSMNADRLVFLSDLEPTEYYKEPLIAPTRDWKANQTVAGGPIKLGGRQYRKGIGMSSKMTLSFAAERKFDLLRATIGINDDTELKGHCIFMVLKDGEEAARIPLAAAEGPKPLNLDITNTETVTLIVDYGKDLDLADHADWAEICFVKEEEE